MVCHHCGSTSAWRNGHRNGFQRLLCKNCGREYLARSLNRAEPNLLLVGEGEKHGKSRVGVQTDAKGGKMECTQIETSGLLKTFPEGLKGKIVEFVIKRENQGYKGTKNILSTLNLLQRNGANLYDPESVKETLKKMKIGEHSKKVYADRYEAFLNFAGGKWEKPSYKVTKKIPFIPMETEIDTLIAGLSLYIATICQVMKETGARIGEVLRLKWIDIDFQRRILAINEPEKGSLAGIYDISEKCVNMINRLPRKSERTFNSSRESIETSFNRQRKRMAFKLANPRLLAIHLHTFRHWYGTMEYHKIRDPVIVQQKLRHKSILNTMIYITIEESLFKQTTDEFIVKAAQNQQEAIQLLEVGFEYVGKIHDIEIFRKRK